MDKKVLTKLTVEQLDKIFASLPVSNPLRDEVAQEIESRVGTEASTPDKDEESEQPTLEKAFSFFESL